MKQKVEQYAQGEFQMVRPKVKLSVSNLKLKVEAGSVYEGRFVIESENDCPIKGMVYDSAYQLRFQIHAFVARKQEIIYRFDATRMEAGTFQNGTVYVITDGGEFQVPYELEIVRPYLESTQGNITDMFQMAKLAESQWEEAVRIYESEKFHQTLAKEEPMYDKIYKSLGKGLSANQALEEFLVYTHKKRALTLGVETKQVHIACPKAIEKHVLQLDKNTWGYTRARISTNAKFILLPKTNITVEDFEENTCQLEYMIDPAYLQDGMHTGEIIIENVYQRIAVEIVVKKEQIASYYQEPKSAIPFHHSRNKRKAALVENYLKYRTGKLTLDAFIEATMLVLQDLISMVEENYIYRLGLLHMNVLAGNTAMVEQELIRIDADQARLVSGNREECYYLYLKALAKHDEQANEHVLELIRTKMVTSHDKLFYFWLLLFVDPALRQDLIGSYRFYQELYRQGMTSPILLLELCNLFNRQPLLLEELGGMEITALQFGLRRGCLSNEVRKQAIELAGKERQFRTSVFVLLNTIYRQTGNDQCLHAICSILIRGKLTDRKYHAYYRAGIERDYKLLGLYECFFKTLNRCEYEKLPFSVLMYFHYQNHVLQNDEKAYLYANVITFKKEYGSCYQEYSAEIENFMSEQLAKGEMSQDLMVIYQEFLSKDGLNPRYAAHMTNIVFKRRLRCNNPNICSVVVSHKEMQAEEEVPLVNGCAYIEIVTESACVALVDQRGNRFVSTIPYQLERLWNVSDFIPVCLKYHPEDYRLLLYVYTHLQPGSFKEARGINIARGVLGQEQISFAMKQKALLHLIQYYYEHFDGEALEKYLLQVDLDYLEPKHSAVMMRYYILRGMYRKAFEMIKQFDFTEADMESLLNLASYLVTDTDLAGDEVLTSLCVYLYHHGQDNENILFYLVYQMKADCQELISLWQRASEVIKDTRELEENILAQLLFTDGTVASGYEVFKSYISGSHRGMVTKAYLKKSAFAYLIQEQQLPDELFGCFIDAYIRDGLRDDIVRAALLQYLSKGVSIGSRETDIIVESVNEFVDRGIILPFFKEFQKMVLLPEDIFLKTYIVCKAMPGETISLTFSVETPNGSIRVESQQFKEMVPGYYMMSFIIFHGEKLLYEKPDVDSCRIRIVESDGLRVDSYIKEGGDSRFDMLNRMIIAQEMRDVETLTSGMLQYLEASHVFEEELTLK